MNRKRITYPNFVAVTMLLPIISRYSLVVLSSDAQARSDTTCSGKRTQK